MAVFLGAVKSKKRFNEGDIVLVKPYKLKAEIIRIVNDNVVVEFLNRRPNGEKRGNYKLKDLK